VASDHLSLLLAGEGFKLEAQRQLHVEVCLTKKSESRNMQNSIWAYIMEAKAIVG
jgi:hypothetical protein